MQVAGAEVSAIVFQFLVSPQGIETKIVVAAFV
jgi:hypothetical protein